MTKRRTTSQDIANLAGVSRTTVSFVLNGIKRAHISEKTRMRVLAAVEQVGYEPDARAQALRSGSTKTIGLIIPDIENPHFWQTADGVTQEARTSGYHLLLSSAELNAEYGKEIFADLSRQRTDGLIVMGAFVLRSEEAQNTLKQLLKQRLPIVSVSAVRPDIDCVVSDYRESTKEVIAYLLSLGHRRIGLIYGVQANGSSALSGDIKMEYEGGADRLLPYQDSLQAAGLPVDQELIITCGQTINDGYRAAQQLLSLPRRPTAMIAINDLLAMGALRAASDLGVRVPADVSVVGYDDIPSANYMIPRLTTTRKDAVQLGREAVKLVLARIQHPGRPRQKVHVPPRLIIRDSTGPAPIL